MLNQVPPEEKYWEESVPFSHVDDDKLREPIMCMLRKYSEICSGQFGKGAVTEHRNELKPDTKPLHQILFLKELPMTEETAGSVKDQLDMVMIELEASE